MKAQNNKLIFVATGLILVAAIARLLPHPPNFAPIASLAIFGGSVIGNKKYAIILPLGALLLSDILFQLFTTTPGFYDISQSFVYGAFILITFLATRIKKVNTPNILLACVWSAAIFFILSNFGVWLTGQLYAKTFTGLVECYTAALPFYKNEFFGNMQLNSVMSNVFFTGLLFGAYSLIKKTVVSTNTQLA
ncbi:DUF6580 family putative transport protein [Ferruginibacter sp. SUN106]|uniref:DUF6580 family putative transport protein n=1 Tax=Ferruginibacter sp. SUN106 TaxID=2978348 RepID=UPI003D366BED